MKERLGVPASRRTRRGIGGRSGLDAHTVGPKARKEAQRQNDIHAPVRGAGTLLYIKGVLRGRSP